MLMFFYIFKQVNRNTKFEVATNLSLHEISQMKREEAIELAKKSQQWQTLFSGGKTYDHATLEIVPNQRMDLHVICNALPGAKPKSKNKKTANVS